MNRVTKIVEAKIAKKLRSSKFGLMIEMVGMQRLFDCWYLREYLLKSKPE
jgi:hypothetical protein